MNHQDHNQQETTPPEQDGHTGHADGGGHGGHRWMMVVCCIPMLAIAIVLVATGVVGVQFIFIALICTAMMAMMMRGGGMSHGDSGQRKGR